MLSSEIETAVIEYFYKKKEIYDKILEFIENEECSKNGEEYRNLIEYFDKYKIAQKRSEFNLFLRSISSISNNHYRCLNFMNKIEEILSHFADQIKQTFTNFEIFHIFKNNKSILLFLFENEIVKVNREISIFLLSNEMGKFFYPEISEFLTEEEKLTINGENEGDFNKKRWKGENDSKICSLIQSNLVVDLVSHLERSKISPSDTIQPSIYETNQFLIKNKKTTLIEYAAFFGSIQIFEYLLSCNVKMDSSLWLYAIHGQNIDIIRHLEEKDVKKPEKWNELFLKESIKCHNKKIAQFFDSEFEKKEKYFQYFIKYYNFGFSHEEIKLKQFSFDDMCVYNYLYIVKVLLNEEKKGFYPLFDNETINDAASKSSFDVVHFLLEKSEMKTLDKTFENNEKMIYFNIPSFITKIGSSAFFGCESLIQIDIPKETKYIGSSSFYKCNSLTQIQIQPDTENLFDCSFMHCLNLSNIIIPNSIKMIGNSVFENCSSLLNISFENDSKLESIGHSCFANCSKLIKITIPSLIQSIKKSTFYNCKSLENVTFSEPCRLKSIGINAFKCCLSLKEIEMPSSVDTIGENSFFGCESLSKVTFNNNDSFNCIESNCFYTCQSLIEITIPSSVKEIKQSAFENCWNLEKVSFNDPSSLEIISNNSFHMCEKLIEIIFPASLKSIKEGAFSGCKSLKKVLFVENSTLDEINENAFEDCSKLAEISIPPSAKSIHKDAFIGCTLLQKNINNH